MPSTAGPTWLVIEPHFDGHHFPYLEHLVQGALARGIDVCVGIGEDAEQGARTRAHLLAQFPTVRVVSAPLPAPVTSRLAIVALAWNEARRRRFLATILKRARADGPVDRILLPYLDWSLFAIGLLGSPFGDTPFSGITMRQRFHMEAQRVVASREQLNRVKGWIFRRLLALPTLTAVFTNDETLAEHFASNGLRGRARVVHIADPSDVRTPVPRLDARRRLGIPTDRCVILLYGFLDDRKGARRLLEWIGSEESPPAVVLAVGRQSNEVSALFDSDLARRLADTGAVFIVNEFVPEADEALYFGAADVVWLGYDRFEMMSGVLVKAAQYGRAVVFYEYGLIAHYAHRHGAPWPGDGDCRALVESLPGDLTIRTFDARYLAAPLPDHSWSNALTLIYG